MLTLDAENRAGRAPNQLVGIGSQSAERALDYTSSDHEEIRAMLGDGAHNSIDHTNVLYDLQWEMHSRRLAVTRKVLACPVDQIGMSPVRRGASKSGIDARHGVNNVKSRAKALAEREGSLQHFRCPRAHVDRANNRTPAVDGHSFVLRMRFRPYRTNRIVQHSCRD